jgi:hypothetical protein
VGNISIHIRDLVIMGDESSVSNYTVWQDVALRRQTLQSTDYSSGEK